MQFVGEVFTPVFGDEVKLTPKHPAKKDGLERWIFNSKKKDDDFLALATGIAELRDEGIQLRDIAVLARTGSAYDAGGIATACQHVGIPVLLPLPGLLSSREGTLVLSALQLAADASDSLSAATILHILSDPKADTPDWIIERLQSTNTPTDQKDGKQGKASRLSSWSEDIRLNRLRAIDHTNLPPSITVQEVIRILTIGDRIKEWGSIAQRASNLDALRGLAESYEQEMHDFGSAATLTGFITWLKLQADNKDDVTSPPYGIDAVTILTYHRAKGLEWPVVILTSLDYARDPDLWEPEITGISDNPTEPLAERHLRYWPWSFGEDQKKKCDLIERGADSDLRCLDAFLQTCETGP